MSSRKVDLDRVLSQWIGPLFAHGRKKSNTVRSRRRLSLESLECRQMLSANSLLELNLEEEIRTVTVPVTATVETKDNLHTSDDPAIIRKSRRNILAPKFIQCT